ncbi:MAG TPA: HAD-IIA family hydrolase [Ktedonobacterales bacterium]|nr:HAD-IIA family hydrolase [Ktedonobacterales bacterium]
MHTLKPLGHFSAYLLDLDGVVYRGEQLLPGARELVEWIDSTGRQVAFVSNNSFATVEEVTEKLARLGTPHPEGRVITAGWATIQVIAQRFPAGRVFPLTGPSVVEMVRAGGLTPTWLEAEDGPTPDAVLIGLDRTLTYERLARALDASLAGAALFAVNRDPRLPVEDGFRPGTGAVVAAVEAASGRRAEMIGKPAPGILLQALAMLGVAREQALMVGDGLDLDIVAGHAAGVTTALTLSGLTSATEAEDATGKRKPEYIFADLADLLAAAQRGRTH